MATNSISIREVGPREGFQIEPAGIPTARKAALIDSLSETGLAVIQAVSFVSPKLIPQFADAEVVLDTITPNPEVDYTAVWFNTKGFDRALAAKALTIGAAITVSGSKAFAMMNWHSESPGLEKVNEPLLDRYQELQIPVLINASAAFGCNFQGRVAIDDVLAVLDPAVASVIGRGLEVDEICLADTMGWANPNSIRTLVEIVRANYPTLPLSLHLHDTRGLGIANAVAGLDVGIDRYDSSIAGLGGCPFSGPAAAGNIATEDLVLLLHEMGYHTGVDPQRILRAAALAEDVVGHPTPSKTLRGGHLLDDGLLQAD